MIGVYGSPKCWPSLGLDCLFYSVFQSMKTPN